MKKKILMLFLMMLSAAAFTACGSSADTETTSDAAEEENVSEEEEEAEEEKEYPIEIESAAGTAVIEDEVNAVAIFDVGMLDTLDTLGYGDRVVAVTHGVTFPDYLEEYESDLYVNLGGFKDWDEEALVESNPDLIFAGFRQFKSIDTVTAIAPTVYFEEANGEESSYLELLEQRVNAITTIFGGEEEAQAYIDEINEKVAKIQEYTSENEITYLDVTVENGGINIEDLGSEGVFLENDLGLTNLNDNKGTSLEGRGSGGGRGGEGGRGDVEGGTEGGRGDVEGETEGGRGAVEGETEGGRGGEGGRTEGGAREGMEIDAEAAEDLAEAQADYTEQNASVAATIIEKNPDLILVYDRDVAENIEVDVTAEEILNGLGLEETNAYKNDNIIYLDTSIWFNASGGLRATIEQLDMLIELLGIDA